MNPAPLGAAQADWLRGPLSFIVGSRDARHRPHLMRAVAGWLDEERRHFTVLMPELHGSGLLADLRANGCIAVVCSEPSSHRTLQLKGRRAELQAAAPEDAVRAAAYLQAFTAEIGQLGFPPRVAQALLAPGGPVWRIRFEIEAAFEQTPGPAAGEPLAAA
jgi:hypothetical protein